METIEEEVATAKRFVELHNSFDVYSNGGLVAIYCNLTNGVYGPVHRLKRPEGGFELQVEISACKSKSSKARLFTWTVIK